MKIVRHRPITRGVTELMYVGDDDAVDKATANMVAAKSLVIGAGVLIWALGKKRSTRTAGLVVSGVGLLIQQA